MLLLSEFETRGLPLHEWLDPTIVARCQSLVAPDEMRILASVPVPALLEGITADRLHTLLNESVPPTALAPGCMSSSAFCGVLWLARRLFGLPLQKHVTERLITRVRDLAYTHGDVDEVWHCAMQTYGHMQHQIADYLRFMGVVLEQPAAAAHAPVKRHRA